MAIFGETIERELPDLAAQGVRTRFIGRRDRAPDRLARADGDAGGGDGRERPPQLWIAFDYGGRAELVEAARRLVADGLTLRRSTRRRSQRGCTRPSCPIRICVIRTSGEQRLSNFLLWQSAYAELVFVETSGPTSAREQLRSAMASTRGRRRRFGGR